METRITISALTSWDATPEDLGIPDEHCFNAKTVLAWLKEEFGSPDGMLRDLDMLYDMDVSVSMVNMGVENPDQLTLDGQPAVLPPQWSQATW